MKSLNSQRRCAHARLRRPLSASLSWLRWLMMIACLATLATARAEEEVSQRAYVFGAFPHLSMGQLEKIYAPIGQEFGRALGREVVFRSKSNFEQFTGELRQRTYDIALVQPFDYVIAHDEYGYLPLARRGETLAAQFMVRPESPLKSMQDLRGKKIGLPPDTAAISHLVKLALARAGIRPDRDVHIRHFRTHDSCLQQLVIGSIDTCGSAPYPVRFFKSKWNVDLRVLSETFVIPHSLFIVHKRVPPKEREMLLRTILSWPKSAHGRALLEHGSLTPFVVATDGEYDVVRDYHRQIRGK